MVQSGILISSDVSAEFANVPNRQTNRQTHITERVTFVAVYGYDYIYEQYAMQPRNNFLRLQEFEKITSLGGVSKFYSKEFLKYMHVDLSDFNDRKDITVCVEWNY